MNDSWSFKLVAWIGRIIGCKWWCTCDLDKFIDCREIRIWYRWLAGFEEVKLDEREMYHHWLIHIILSNSKFPYESSKWACDLISIKSNDRYSSEKHHIISFTTSPGVVASAIIDLPLILAKLRVGLQYVVRSWCLPSLSHAKSVVLVPVSWCVIADYHRICSCYFQCLCCSSTPKSTRLLVSLYFIGRSLGNTLCRSSHDSWLWSHHSWKVIATLRTRLSSSKTTSAISQEIDAMTSIIPKPPSSLENESSTSTIYSYCRT